MTWFLKLPFDDNIYFHRSATFDKYDADKYVCLSVGMPVVNSSLIKPSLLA